MNLRVRCKSCWARPWICLCAILASWPGPAQAGPPFVTDDPEPVEYQHWEFYVASIHSKYGGDWSGTAPHIELNYGAVPDLQLHLIAPMAYDSPPLGNFHYGFGDAEVGAKYRFIHETNGWPQVGVFPLLELPTGSAPENLGNGNTQAFIPLWTVKNPLRSPLTNCASAVPATQCDGHSLCFTPFSLTVSTKGFLPGCEPAKLLWLPGCQSALSISML